MYSNHRFYQIKAQIATEFTFLVSLVVVWNFNSTKKNKEEMLDYIRCMLAIKVT